MNDTDFPPLYQAANDASNGAQKQFLLALGINLSCLVLAAAMSVINYPHASFAVTQTLILLISLGLSIYLAVKQPQRIWYGTRALAESVKTVTWRYVMRAEPFDLPDQIAHRHFVCSLQKIFDTNKHISSHAVNFGVSEVVTEGMAAIRMSELANCREIYRTGRIRDQLNWYRKKAKWNKHRSRAWFVALVTANALALISAAFRIEFPTVEHWPTDVFVALSAALLAWTQTKQFQELSATYTLTAHEILLLGETIPKSDEQRLFSNFVGDAENAFSREHTQWQARRDTD